MAACLEPYCSPLRIEKNLGVSTEEFFQGVAVLRFIREFVEEI